MPADRGSRWPYPGARWWKFDLHTHTPASVDYGAGPTQASLRGMSPRDWLLDYMRAGVDCVAVTDHNSGEWIDELKAALAALEREASSDYRPLHLFPGVEITANGGIHVLAVLGPGKGSSHVATLLGAAGYGGEPGCSDVAASKAPIGVVEAILDAGGLPILAHVDGPSGAGALPGNTLKPLRDVEGLLAVEVVDADREMPGAYRENRPAWAEVLGSDSHHPSGGRAARFPGSHYTWVKMARPSLEGLRLALLDGGGFSIRRSDEAEALDPFARPGHFVEAIEIGEARYMGRGEPSRLEFHPAFNVLVGGRGTGNRIEIAAGPGNGAKVLNHPVPPAFRESVKVGEQNLYARARELIGDRDARAYEYTIQLRPFDADTSGAGLGLPVLVACVGGLLERSTRGGTIIVGPLNLGGSLERLPNPVAVAELAVDKQAATLLMPVTARRALNDLPDDLWTKINVEFYSDPADGVFKALLE